jgi:hypothetical protein
MVDETTGEERRRDKCEVGEKREEIIRQQERRKPFTSSSRTSDNTLREH